MSTSSSRNVAFHRNLGRKLPADTDSPTRPLLVPAVEKLLVVKPAQSSSCSRYSESKDRSSSPCTGSRCSPEPLPAETSDRPRATPGPPQCRRKLVGNRKMSKFRSSRTIFPTTPELLFTPTPNINRPSASLFEVDVQIPLAILHHRRSAVNLRTERIPVRVVVPLRRPVNRFAPCSSKFCPRTSVARSVFCPRTVSSPRSVLSANRL